MAFPSNGQLPPRPSLEQSRNQARELLRAYKAGDAAALARVRQHHPQPSGSPFTLTDAQLVIAREAGLPSWPRLRRQIERITGPDRARPFVRELSYYDDRAQGMLSVLETGQRRAVELVRRYHPRFGDATDADIRAAALSQDDARLVLAQEHGYLTWEAFARSVEALARGEASEPFMEAFEAIQANDLARLDALLRQHPELAMARGTNGNRLLQLANTAPVVKRLLEAGADPNAANNKGWTALHGAAYTNPKQADGASVEILRLLLDAGARVDLSAHGDGGTPLVQALFWGHRPQAELLAERGLVPNNLRVAAGLGRLDRVRSFFTHDGRLKPQAGAHREFHRPHSGFPAWQPSDAPQEILDEALVWAAKSNRTEPMGFLIERGADPNGDPYRGTPLIWAAVNGHLAAAGWLLEHGADVNRRATFGGPQHGQGVTALHLAAQNGNLEIVRFLVEHGADPGIEDALYHSTPAGWAQHSEHSEVSEYLKGRQGKTESR
jgi:ankyrin repeat protein